MTINDKVNAIQSREDFIGFLYALSKDFHDTHESWENLTIEEYLGAIAAWLSDTKNPGPWNEGDPIPVNTDWKSIARIFLSGKIYE